MTTESWLPNRGYRIVALMVLSLKGATGVLGKSFGFCSILSQSLGFSICALIPPQNFCPAKSTQTVHRLALGCGEQSPVESHPQRPLSDKMKECLDAPSSVTRLDDPWSRPGYRHLRASRLPRCGLSRRKPTEPDARPARLPSRSQHFQSFQWLRSVVGSIIAPPLCDDNPHPVRLEPGRLGGLSNRSHHAGSNFRKS